MHIVFTKNSAGDDWVCTKKGKPQCNGMFTKQPRLSSTVYHQEHLALYCAARVAVPVKIDQINVGRVGGERANVEPTILLFDIFTTTTPSEGDPLMVVVWGRSQPQRRHLEMHVKWVQQTHTAGLLQTWQLHDARGVRHQLPNTDVKVRRPS